VEPPPPDVDIRLAFFPRETVEGNSIEGIGEVGAAGAPAALASALSNALDAISGNAFGARASGRVIADTRRGLSAWVVGARHRAGR
jgi:hypothetical protein